MAWPYANGPLHLGHVAGCYLAADIFARYHRLKGNRVLMVSGSDSHGTPITVRADQEGVSPQEILDRYHAQFLDTWKQLGISFDLFTTTHTENHQSVVHDIFQVLQEKGYIYPDVMLLARCNQCDRFLPDRYVEGLCPHCGHERARGDQCDQCGRTLDPAGLEPAPLRVVRDDSRVSRLRAPLPQAFRLPGAPLGMGQGPKPLAAPTCSTSPTASWRMASRTGP